MFSAPRTTRAEAEQLDQQKTDTRASTSSCRSMPRETAAPLHSSYRSHAVRHLRRSQRHCGCPAANPAKCQSRSENAARQQSVLSGVLPGFDHFDHNWKTEAKVTYIARNPGKPRCIVTVGRRWQVPTRVRLAALGSAAGVCVSLCAANKLTSH